MGLVFWVSLIILILGWILTISGLKLSIKYKKENNYTKGKFWYRVFLVGDLLSNAWYFVILSLLLKVARYITL